MSEIIDRAMNKGNGWEDSPLPRRNGCQEPLEKSREGGGSGPAA